MATDKILSEVEGPVGRIIFNNPEKHNAVSLDMWAAVEGYLEEFKNDDDIRVVVLTGAGGRAFVSGADISRFENERASEEAIKNYNENVSRAYDSIYNFPKPTIAMIRGYCIGGGMGLATVCDLRVCTEASTFAVPAAKLGLGYGHDKVRLLMNLVGPSFVKDIFFTARQFKSEEAYNMGFINKIVADDDLETYVQEYAERIAANAPLTISHIKKVAIEMVKDVEERDMGSVIDAFNKCFNSEDYKEGRTSFMEKRKPQFQGK
ncbi:MAG: enoyl-CoA hydratase [Rhodospirillaceae bacterium]|jgi:enoyl-CoA hydratase/carnithine racemase|nr:enoyl-CoA hydratase [Rhodospirillales bacterium]MBT3905702.1 enoyl-CoA hydratase [Rhodospirillaceae bacterium]MBT4699947.1 enoyl-CoA hydratase [Rhodospirillaceae bacterium]MBT5034305.1 enoyl-CoA hydratase [Rhodospirillaceae bacterium]MBT6221701.1 enoyl-CoA hydratase [Rhodospirillaceae bacterium]